eukprot:498925-Rhodomonas_salina.1
MVPKPLKSVPEAVMSCSLPGYPGYPVKQAPPGPTWAIRDRFQRLVLAQLGQSGTVFVSRVTSAVTKAVTTFPS